MPLLAAFAWLSARFEMPFRLREVGASAGLNLRFDRYRYDGGNWQWGDARSSLLSAIASWPARQRTSTRRSSWTTESAATSIRSTQQKMKTACA